jgi:hypothetical protein
MHKPEVFLKANLSLFGYRSKQDIIERLYLQSLVDSYGRIAHTVSTENDIRDRFMHDLYTTHSQLKDWLQGSLIFLDWENWKFKPGMTLARADISFKLTGCEFIMECKRLNAADKAYIDEGLARFVTLHYAQGHEYTGMIAFVTNDKSDVILNGLKTRVANYHALSTPFSAETYGGLSSSFQSSHERSDGTSVNVYHLVFAFNGLTATAPT